MEKKAFGTHEIAEICHVTPATVGHWIEKGLLPSFSTGGGHRRVWDSDLAEYLKAHNIPLPEELKTINEHHRVLIVDDEEEVRMMIVRALKSFVPALEIHEASDGFEAGQKLSQLLPELVVLDIKLPGIDGMKVCQMIRSNEALKQIKILAISGHHPEQFKTDSLSAGADEFLAKPFDAQQIKKRVSGLLNLENKS